MKISPTILLIVIAIAEILLGRALAQDETKPPMTDNVEQIMKQATKLIQQEKLDEAEALLQQAISQVTDIDSLPLRNLMAALYQSRKDFVAEAATYHDILQIAPDNVDAQRARVLAILRMGAADLATDYALASQDVFSSEEIHTMQQMRVGRLVKWGEIEARYGIGPERFEATDKGISENNRLRLALAHAGEHNSPAALHARFDYIVALRNRIRMKEAIEFFLDLQQQGISMPPYVLAAAADAYLYLRKPKLARNLYLRALELTAKNSQHPEREWQFGLLQAYMDNYQFDAAQQLAEQLKADIPPVLHFGLNRAEVDNEYYERIAVDTVRTRLYADRLNESQSMLSDILNKAPFNLDARLTLGELKIARNQPRNAQNQFISVMVDDPANLYASAGIAQTAMLLGDYATAQHHVDMLTEAYPENYTVQRAQKDLQAHLRPRLTLISGIGKSSGGSGGNRGNNDWRLDAILSSGALSDNYSVYARTFNSRANFNGDVALRRRIGAGVQYHRPNWRVGMEVDGNQTGRSQIGASLNTTWFASDHWQFNGSFESNSNNIPLQAHGVGVKAKALAVGARFTHNESRNLGINLMHLWLNDGNRRMNAGVDWFERWVSGPVYKLDTRFAVSASKNTRSNVPYFNPPHDVSLDLHMINEWMLWRRDRLSFSHRIMLGIGGYWQQGFGMKETPNVRYEHQWNIDTLRSLNYGIEYSRHPFDGVVNKRAAVFFNITHHF